MDKPNRAEDASEVVDWPLRVAILAVGVLFAALLASIVPRFDTNDDVAMMLAANGFTYGAPSEQLVFAHILIGSVLRSLYVLQPEVPWYIVYLYGVQIVAWVLIFRALLVLRGAGSTVIALVVGVLSFGLLGVKAMAAPQFTSTSMTLAAAAVFHHLATARRDRSSRWAVVGGLLLAFSGLIRFQSLVAALVFALPVLLRFGPAIPLRRNAALVAALTLGLLVAGVADRVAYAGDEGWREYLAFNRARGELENLNDSEPDPAALETVGWTSEEYFLFQNWYFVDREVYTTEKIQSLAAAIERPARDGLEVFENATLRSRLPLLAALSVALALWAPRRALPMLLVVWVWAVLVAVGVQFQFSRFHERVALPALLATCLSSVLVCGVPAPRSPMSFRRRILAGLATATTLLVAVVAVASEVRALVGESSLNRSYAQHLRRDLLALQAAGPNDIFVHWPPSLLWKDVSPYQLAYQLPRPHVIALGWEVRSPAWRDQLAELGISDLGRAIVTRDDIHVLCRFSCGSERMLALEAHLNARYGIAGKFQQRRLSRAAPIASWRFVRAKTPPETPAH